MKLFVLKFCIFLGHRCSQGQGSKALIGVIWDSSYTETAHMSSFWQDTHALSAKGRHAAVGKHEKTAITIPQEWLWNPGKLIPEVSRLARLLCSGKDHR